MFEAVEGVWFFFYVVKFFVLLRPYGLFRWFIFWELGVMGLDRVGC